MLERVFNFLLLFKEYTILTGLVVLSLLLLSVNDTPQVKQLRTIAAVGLGVIQDQVSFIPGYFRLAEENRILRRLNIDLADEANRLREARLENMRLRGLVGLSQAPNFTFLAAKVVNKNLLHLRNTLTLNIGMDDGVAVEMPVLSDAGLVGVVIEASRHYSVVNILLNTDFRVSARDQRSRVDGILAWDGSELRLTYIAKTLDVQVGDPVITSPYSNTAPDGVRIGVVSEVSEEAATLFRRVVVTPAVDFQKLEEVFVLAMTPDREREALEQSVLERYPR